MGGPTHLPASLEPKATVDYDCCHSNGKTGGFVCVGSTSKESKRKNLRKKLKHAKSREKTDSFCSPVSLPLLCTAFHISSSQAEGLWTVSSEHHVCPALSALFFYLPLPSSRPLPFSASPAGTQSTLGSHWPCGDLDLRFTYKGNFKFGKISYFSVISHHFYVLQVHFAVLTKS